MSEEDPTTLVPPHLAPVVQELLDEVENIEPENYDWIDDTFDISLCEFQKRTDSPIILYFMILLDNSEWDMLADGLGLKSSEIEWCRKYYKHGPTEEVFSLLDRKGELQHLTLGQVLHQLIRLNQKSILREIPWQKCIQSFRDAMGTDGQPNNSSDSLTSGDECGHKGHSPAAPNSFSFSTYQAPEVLVASANEGIVSNENINSCNAKLGKTPVKSKFAARILMIFASDTKEHALKVADQLRTAQGSRREIGVMILTPANSALIENALLRDAGSSIYKWFKQVDFVVPVLSPKFLRQIQDRDPDPSTLYERRYNRYLYRLLLDDFVENMSKNCKCRPLCHQEYYTEVRKSELVSGNGLLQMVWNCCDKQQFEEYVQILISGAKERRRQRKVS